MLEFVNAAIGTLNERRFSNGNIYPVTALPFGMAHFTVQTDGSAGNWFYSPAAHTFEGFRLTHQPSPWVGDYGHLLLLPFSGRLYAEGNRWSSIRPGDAVVRPDMLQYDLQRYGVRASLTPTERGCVIRVENRAGGDTALALIPYAPSAFSVKGNVLCGHTDSRTIWGFEIREYLYAAFSQEPSETLPLENGGVAVRFAGPVTEISLAAGFVSPEQTERNFGLELGGKTFSEVAAAARGRWEELLQKIEVSDEDPQKKRTFYSCLYRTLLYPRVFHENSASGPVHYNADTRRVEKGVFYTDNGFWDTYRTVYPLLSLLMPEKVGEMAEGFLNYSDETGWLPKWLSPGEIGLMPGTLVEAVIADAAVKGLLTREQTERAYRAMLRNAYEKSKDPRHGRTGVEEYIRYGYVPADVRESVNHTLDSAYGDFCISRVAALLGEKEQAAALEARSKCYRNLFDAKSRFFRGKDREGNFRPAFDPFEWGGDNCEGSSWQNSFNVCHDIEGLARLHGGREALLARLDELFAAPPVYRVGRYEQEIHEMSEMACADFGQCAISNQPSFHIPWLYAALGERQKTELWVEKLAAEAFSAEPDGFPGDEDNGTMAAWYVFACLGFYPLCPAEPRYIAAKPLFSRVTLCGKEIVRAETQYLSHAELTRAR